MASRDLQLALLGLTTALDTGLKSAQRNQYREAEARRRAEQDAWMREMRLRQDRRSEEHLRLRKQAAGERTGAESGDGAYSSMWRGVPAGSVSAAKELGLADEGEDPGVVLSRLLNRLQEKKTSAPAAGAADDGLNVGLDDEAPDDAKQEEIKALEGLEKALRGKGVTPKALPKLSEQEINDLLKGGRGAPQRQGGGPQASAAPQQQLPGLADMAKLPQGENAQPIDQVKLAELMTNYSIVKGLTPASPQEIAMAWQWLVNHIPLGKMPLSIEAQLSGMGGPALA